MAWTVETWVGTAVVIAIGALVMSVLAAEFTSRWRGRHGVLLLSHHTTMALIEVIIFTTLAFVLLCSVAK
jgi:hypothetical protein